MVALSTVYRVYQMYSFIVHCIQGVPRVWLYCPLYTGCTKCMFALSTVYRVYQVYGCIVHCTQGVPRVWVNCPLVYRVYELFDLLIARGKVLSRQIMLGRQ